MNVCSYSFHFRKDTRRAQSGIGKPSLNGIQKHSDISV